MNENRSKADRERSQADRDILLRLLNIVIEANNLVPSSSPSPNIEIHIPDTRVTFRATGTTAPGFSSLNTRLALAALQALKSLVSQNGLRHMLIDVHDGYLGYGPWAIVITPSPINVANATHLPRESS